MKKLNFRPYQNEEDYWRIREFLRQVMLRNNRREHSWHVARLDYWWWFGNPDLEKIPLEENVFIWETDTKQIGAVLNPEVRGQAYAHIHPDFYTTEFEEEVIGAAEKYLVSPDPDGHLKLCYFLDSQQRSRQELLARYGFQRVERQGEQEVQHRRNLDDDLPEVMPISGYTIRSMGHGLEMLERCYASGLGFHEDDINIARDNRDHPQWYQ
ncbi:MAG: hypothetical protein IH586_06290, partial [Anaerolineaceae bacterium]|nr:hypothetical protein [Anaerolineaceae bacterium]